MVSNQCLYGYVRACVRACVCVCVCVYTHLDLRFYSVDFNGTDLIFIYLFLFFV